jgi:hypothetical protein
MRPGSARPSAERSGTCARSWARTPTSTTWTTGAARTRTSRSCRAASSSGAAWTSWTTIPGPAAAERAASYGPSLKRSGRGVPALGRRGVCRGSWGLSRPGATGRRRVARPACPRVEASPRGRPGSTTTLLRRVSRVLEREKGWQYRAGTRARRAGQRWGSAAPAGPGRTGHAARPSAWSSRSSSRDRAGSGAVSGDGSASRRTPTRQRPR